MRATRPAASRTPRTATIWPAAAGGGQAGRSAFASGERNRAIAAMAPSRTARLIVDLPIAGAHATFCATGCKVRADDGLVSQATVVLGAAQVSCGGTIGRPI